MTTMSLKLAAACLKANVNADIPAFLWGPPGVGKSEVIDQVAGELNMPVIDFRASLRDPVDLRGLPLVDQKTGTTRWLPPAELPNEKTHGPRGILKLDELNTASPAVQAACFGLVLERRLGEYHLPKGWVPIAAGNRMIDRAAAQRMPSALKNRFAHYEVAADLSAWTEWAARVNLHPAVVAFVRFRPEMLHKMPTGEENAFPTPRAWEKVARIADAPEEIRQHLVSALVGPAVAGEFEGFMRIWKRLPSIDDIFRDPKAVHVPSMNEPATLYAVSAAISRLVDKKTLANALEYAMRLPKEFEIMLTVDAMRRDPSLQKTPAFCKWIERNQEVTL